MTYEHWHSLVERKLKSEEKEFPPIIAFFNLDDYHELYNMVNYKVMAELVIDNYKMELEKFELLRGIK